MSGDLGRFSEFAVSMMQLVRPPDSQVSWIFGQDMTNNYNRMIEALRPQDEWFWIMGDDHFFDPLLLVQLLMHDVDVVVPYCLERYAPFKPVTYSGIQGTDAQGRPLYEVADLPRSGIAEVYAAGSAGMLIRRHVLDALPRPVFQRSSDYQNEDLILCDKIREAGFKIWCDVDARLGHLGVMGVIPVWLEGQWRPVLQSGSHYLYPQPLNPPDEELPPAA